MKKKSYDVFISHASEDKESFVTPLAVALRKRGLKVWFDRFELRVGDSLREAIESGLAQSRYGVVVYSPFFFKKRWPKKELNGLFSREISGRKKRILPVLHHVSVDDLRRRYPIQSDRLSLSSEAPMEELCDQLIQVIKPELLRLEEMERRSSDASNTFLEELEKKHPGFSFSITTSSVSEQNNDKPERRIEIRMTGSDLASNPPSLRVTFLGVGAEKAINFRRTGKVQEWTSKEFVVEQSDIPLINATTRATILRIGPLPDLQPRPVKVEIRGSSTVTFNLMYLSRIRMGSEEGELRVSSPNEGFSFNFTSLLTGLGRIDFTFAWKLSGFGAKQCLRTIRAIDQLIEGTTIFVTDLAGDAPPLEVAVPAAVRLGAYDAASRKLIELCAQIEDYFKIVLRMRKDVEEAESVQLGFLNTLLNRLDYSAAIEGTIEITKGKNEEFDSSLCSGAELALSVFSEVLNYPGYFEIFGQKIFGPSWGVLAPCIIAMSSADRETYCGAEPGSTMSTPVKSVGAAKLVWASELKTGFTPR